MSAPSPTTQTVLLLCARLGQPINPSAAPLRPREFARLVAWLRSHHFDPSDLAQLEIGALDPPIPSGRLRALLARDEALSDTLCRWTERGIWAVSATDPVYPDRLRQLGTSMPPLICGVGDPILVASSLPALAVVGSRHADTLALAFARSIGIACAGQRMHIVSGGARGVDREAMTATLDAGGTAIGILGDSLAGAATSRLYRDALHAGKLALVSPYDPYSPFSVGAAMGRNKYIYALADAGIVVSTAHGSGGTWTGAIEALKAGRRVYVWLGEGAPEANRYLVEAGAISFVSERMENLSGLLIAQGS